jgi:hypothetical protein
VSNQKVESIATWDRGPACDQSEGEEYRAGLSIGMGPKPVRYICSKCRSPKLDLENLESNFGEASKKCRFKFFMTRKLTSFNWL